MKDIKIVLDGKDQTNETEYVSFGLYVPQDRKQDQIRYFPFSGEWMIDLTTIRDDTPLPTSVGYYKGRNFKIRKYVICEENDENYELVFTDSKKKVDQFVSSRTEQENEFLDDLRKKARERLAKING